MEFKQIIFTLQSKVYSVEMQFGVYYYTTERIASNKTVVVVHCEKAHFESARIFSNFWNEKTNSDLIIFVRIFVFFFCSSNNFGKQQAQCVFDVWFWKFWNGEKRDKNYKRIFIWRIVSSWRGSYYLLWAINFDYYVESSRWRGRCTPILTS